MKPIKNLSVKFIAIISFCAISVFSQWIYNGTSVRLQDTTNRVVIGRSSASTNARLEIARGNGGSDPTMFFSCAQVAHGMTGIVPTNVFGRITSDLVSAGSLRIDGFSDNNIPGLLLRGISGSTPAASAVEFYAQKKSGTGSVGLQSSERAFSFLSTGELMTIYGTGDIQTNGNITLNKTAAKFSVPNGQVIVNQSDPVGAAVKIRGRNNIDYLGSLYVEGCIKTSGVGGTEMRAAEFSAGWGTYTTNGIIAYAGGGSYRNIAIHGYCTDPVGADYAGFFEGNVHVTGTFTNPSDETLKKDEVLLNGSLAKIMRLKPKKYFYRIDEFSNMILPENEQIGLIAQEVEGILPEVVHEVIASPSKDLHFKNDNRKSLKEIEKYKGVDYISLIPVLVQAIQEQQNQIEELKRALEER